MNVPMADLERGALQTVIGKTVGADTSGAEGKLDCSSLGGDDYPKRVILHARDADMYVAQGGPSVALDGTAANNFLMRADERAELVISSGGEAWFAHKQVSAAGRLAVTRVDKV